MNEIDKNENLYSLSLSLSHTHSSSKDLKIPFVLSYQKLRKLQKSKSSRGVHSSLTTVFSWDVDIYLVIVVSGEKPCTSGNQYIMIQIGKGNIS